MNLLQRKEIVIVASGPSLRGFDFKLIPDSVDVLAVNSTINFLPRVTHWFTLDPSPVNRIIMSKATRKRSIEFYAAVPNDYGCSRAKCESHRNPPELNVHFLIRVEGDGPWKSCYGLSETTGKGLHTGNSAYGALGLCYLLGYTKIVFLGLDGKTGSRWCDSGQTNDLSHLPLLFRSTLAQLHMKGVQVVNANVNSAVECFEKMKPVDAFKWLTK